jgi:tetratricopeptide (TPR) repeat protein
MTENIRLAMDKARAGLVRDPGNPAYTFYLAGGLGFLGRLQMAREQWADALTSGWEAYRLLEAASKRSVENKDILLGLGVFNVYAGRLPDTLRQVAALLGVRGDWQLGLRQLHEAADHAPFAGVEARISLAFLYAYTIRDAPKAVAMLEPLVQRFPDNPTFLITLADAETSLGRYESAISNAQLCLRRIEEGRFPASWRFRILAQLGKIEFSRDDFRKALPWLDQAARIQPMPKNPGNYLAWVHYRRGKIYARYGYRVLAEKDFNQAVTTGGSDRVAELARQELDQLKRPR